MTSPHLQSYYQRPSHLICHLDNCNSLLAKTGLPATEFFNPVNQITPLLKIINDFPHHLEFNSNPFLGLRRSWTSWIWPYLQSHFSVCSLGSPATLFFLLVIEHSKLFPFQRLGPYLSPAWNALFQHCLWLTLYTVQASTQMSSTREVFPYHPNWNSA